MESEWELDRIRLYQLRRAHPDWTLPRLARRLKRCLSWVKKWLKRFREAGQITLETFMSHSRAPHSRPREVVPVVRDAILGLRDELTARYGRVVGAKTILYHLQRESLLQAKVYICHAPAAQSGRCSKKVDASRRACVNIILSNALKPCSTGKWISVNWAIDLSS